MDFLSGMARAAAISVASTLSKILIKLGKQPASGQNSYYVDLGRDATKIRPRTQTRELGSRQSLEFSIYVSFSNVVR